MFHLILNPNLDPCCIFLSVGQRVRKQDFLLAVGNDLAITFLVLTIIVRNFLCIPPTLQIQVLRVLDRLTAGTSCSLLRQRRSRTSCQLMGQDLMVVTGRWCHWGRPGTHILWGACHLTTLLIVCTSICEHGLSTFVSSILILLLFPP